MLKVNTNLIPEVSWTSPKGKFAGAGIEVSEALGRMPHSTDLMRRHPFDVEILRLKPGQTPYPYHSHSAQWEFYHVIAGNGTVRHEDGTTPIEAGDAPNVFVSVTLLRGADASTHQIHQPEYRVGYCELEVEDPTNLLQVEVSVAATNCLPAQTVQATVQLRDAAGQPVPGAEVTLYAVDEGVLGLTDYSVPDLKATLLAARRLDVQCGISLPLLMSEDPEQLTFHNKGYLGGGGGKEPAPRSRFMPCAYWNASLLTDVEGRVNASFVAPDSLTRYRVIAVAHSLQNQFGSGKTEFTVSKPLSIEPALPQVANVTDQLRVRAVVQNQTAEAGQVLVSLQLDDKVQNDTTNLSQTVSIEPHGTAAVEFPVTLGSTGTARWLWHARFADQTIHTNQQFTDSVQSTLRVGNITPLLREVALVRCDAGETNLLQVLIPDRVRVYVSTKEAEILKQVFLTASRKLSAPHHPPQCLFKVFDGFLCLLVGASSL